MRYLVSGGAGFIGSHVCEALLKRGDEVACVDDFNDFYDPKIKQRNIAALRKTAVLHKNGRFTVFEMDITNHSGLQFVFANFKPEKVIHLAARVGVRQSIADPLLYTNVNVIGTQHMLEFSKDCRVKNFVFASSSSVYGERSNGPFSENDRVDNPISPYAATKKAGELLCATYHHLFSIPVTCLRFFTVYGPCGRPDMAPYKFMRAIMEGRQIDVYGDGETKRDYTYIDDIVNGVIAASDKEPPYAIVNLGNSHPVALHELIATIEYMVGKKAATNRLPPRPGDVSQTYADVTLARKLLGWQPHTSLKDGLRELYVYLRSLDE